MKSSRSPSTLVSLSESTSQREQQPQQQKPDTATVVRPLRSLRRNGAADGSEGSRSASSSSKLLDIRAKATGWLVVMAAVMTLHQHAFLQSHTPSATRTAVVAVAAAGVRSRPNQVQAQAPAEATATDAAFVPLERPIVVDSNEGDTNSSDQSSVSIVKQGTNRDEVATITNVSEVTSSTTTIPPLDARPSTSKVQSDKIAASPSMPTQPVGKAALSTASLTVQNRQQKRCQLSSYSTDGIGHQIEGKLSCLATALALNWTYVHQVVDAVEHDQNAMLMEDVFGLSRAVPQWPNDLAVMYNDTEMMIHQRELFFHHGLYYNGGRCYSPSVLRTKFRDMCDAETASEETRAVVLSGDNCWDYFWCQSQPLPNEWWTTIVPVLRQSLLLNHPLPTSRAAGHARPKDLVTVAIHVRLGDAGIRKMDRIWGALVLSNLYAGAQAVATGNITLQVSIHSDGERDEVMDILGIDPVKVAAGTIVFYCRGDQQATIQQAMTDMITADILVASESSLTHTAALMRYPHDGPVLHPPSDFCNRMSDIMGWHLLRKSAASMPKNEYDNSDTVMRLERCTQALSEDDMDCQGWTATDLQYWSNLISTQAAANKRRF